VALYDPRQSITFNPSCGGQNFDIDGLKSMSEPYGFISALHSEILAIILFVAGFVLYMIYTSLCNMCKIIEHCKETSLIESIWALIPAIIFAIILCVSVVPSFILLYSLDEIVEPSLTIKEIGREWYWSYEYGDFDYDGDPCFNNIAMTSPHESSNGWFSGFKHWWCGESQSKVLTPVEATQKNIDLLNKHVQGEFDRCIQYNKEIETSSPRSATIAKHKQEECFGYVTREVYPSNSFKRSSHEL
jgi:heme/copper-type cytochrome/quinol oxidase subunit 2